MTKFYLLTATLASLLILAACGGGATPPARANCATNAFHADCNNNPIATILRNQACTANPNAHGLCTAMAHLGGVLVRYCADNPADTSVGCSLPQFNAARISRVCPTEPFTPLCYGDDASAPARIAHCATGMNATQDPQCLSAFTDTAQRSCFNNPFTEACEGEATLGSTANADVARASRFTYCSGTGADPTLCTGFTACNTAAVSGGTDGYFANECGTPFQSDRIQACAMDASAHGNCAQILAAPNAARWQADATITPIDANGIPTGTEGFLADPAEAIANATDIAEQGQVHLGTELRAPREDDDENADRTINPVLPGNTDNGVAFYITNSGARFAGVFPTTNLGAPITDPALNGSWPARMRILTADPATLASLQTTPNLTITGVFPYVVNFNLNVTFGGRTLLTSKLGDPSITSVGEIDAFVPLTAQDGRTTHLVIDGEFDINGFITGTTLVDNFMNNDEDMPVGGTAATSGLLSGVIGADGAVAAFHSNTAGTISHVGGLVATPQGLTLPADVIYDNWRDARVAPKTTPTTARANEFLRGNTGGTALVGDDLTDDDDEDTTTLAGSLNLNTGSYDGIAFGGEAASGVAFYRFAETTTDMTTMVESTARNYYAGLLSGTDVGRPIVQSTQDVAWHGSLSYILGQDDAVITRDMTLNIDFQQATIDALVEINEADNTYFQINGVFFRTSGANPQVIEGTTTYGEYDVTSSVFDTTNMPTSAGVLSGLVGQDGIVGAFISGTTADGGATITANTGMAEHYAGGFVVAPPALDSRFSYGDWVQVANPAAAPNTTTRTNEFLQTDATGALPGAFTRSGNLNLATRDYRGSSFGRDAADTNGVGFYRLEVGADNYYYAGLFSGADLGAPLDISRDGKATWKGYMRYITGSNTTADMNMLLNIDFATSSVTSLFKATRNNSETTHFQLTGNFGTRGVISGNVIYGNYADGAFATEDATTPGRLTGLIGQDGALGVFYSDNSLTLAGGPDCSASGSCATGFVGGFIAAPVVNYADWLDSLDPEPTTTNGLSDGAGFVLAGTANTIAINPATPTHIKEHHRVLRFRGTSFTEVRFVEPADATGSVSGVSLMSATVPPVTEVTSPPDAVAPAVAEKAYFASAITRGTDLGKPLPHPSANRSATARWDGRVALLHGAGSFVATTGEFETLFDLCLNFQDNTFSSKSNTSRACGASDGDTDATNDFDITADGHTLSFTGSWGAERGVISGTTRFNTTNGILSGLIGEDGAIGVFHSMNSDALGDSDIHYAGGFAASRTAEDPAVNYNDWTRYAEANTIDMDALTAADDDEARFSQTTTSSNTINVHSTHDIRLRRVLRLGGTAALISPPSGTTTGVSLLAANADMETELHFATAITRGTNLGEPLPTSTATLATWSGRAAVFHGSNAFDTDDNVFNEEFELCLNFNDNLFASQADGGTCVSPTTNTAGEAITEEGSTNTLTFNGGWDDDGVINTGAVIFNAPNGASPPAATDISGTIRGLIGQDGALGVFYGGPGPSGANPHFAGGFVASDSCDDAGNAFETRCAGADGRTARAAFCSATATAWDSRCETIAAGDTFASARDAARGRACVANGIAADSRCATHAALVTHCQGRSATTTVCDGSTTFVRACEGAPFGAGCVALDNIATLRANWCAAGNTDDGCSNYDDVNDVAWTRSFGVANQPPTTVGTLSVNAFLSIADGETAIDTTGLTTSVIGGTTGGLTRAGDTEDGFSYAGGTTMAGGSTPLYFAGILPTTDLGAFRTETTGTVQWSGRFAYVNTQSEDITFNLGFTGTGGTITGLGTDNSAAYDFNLTFTRAGIISGGINVHNGSDASTDPVGVGTVSGLIGQDGLVGAFISDAGSNSVFSGGFVASPRADYATWLADFGTDPAVMPSNDLDVADGAHFVQTNDNNGNNTTSFSPAHTAEQVLRLDTLNLDAKADVAMPVMGVALGVAGTNTSIFAAGITVSTNLGAPATGATNEVVGWTGHAAVLHGANVFAEGTGIYSQPIELCINLNTRAFASNTDCMGVTDLTSGTGVVSTSGSDTPDGSTLTFNGTWNSHGLIDTGSVTFTDGTNSVTSSDLTGLVGTLGAVGVFHGSQGTTNTTDFHFVGGFVADPSP